MLIEVDIVKNIKNRKCVHFSSWTLVHYFYLPIVALALIIYLFCFQNIVNPHFLWYVCRTFLLVIITPSHPSLSLQLSIINKTPLWLILPPIHKTWMHETAVTRATGSTFLPFLCLLGCFTVILALWLIFAIFKGFDANICRCKDDNNIFPTRNYRS